MRAVRRALSGLLAIAIAGRPLSAQATRSLDAGAGVVRFPDDGRWIAGPWLRLGAQRDALDARWRAMTTMIVSGQGIGGSAEGAASRRGTTRWRGVLWEVGGEGSALFGGVSRASESALASGHLALPIGDAGVRIGGATHLAHRESGLLRGHSVSGDAWWHLPRATIVTALTRQWAQGQLFAGDTRDFLLGVVPVRYVEASAGVVAQPVWGTLDATLGARRDADAAQRTEALWSLGAFVRATESTGLTLDVTRQAADYVRGADALQSVSVGLRFVSSAPRQPPAPRAGAVVELVSAGEGEPRTLRLRVPGAHAVEVMGDFTDWAPATLSPSAGEFVLRTPLAAGAHRLLVRIDGGAWEVPANTPAVDDDLGGRVGLMIVP